MAHNKGNMVLEMDTELKGLGEEQQNNQWTLHNMAFHLYAHLYHHAVSSPQDVLQSLEFYLGKSILCASDLCECILW